MEKTPDRRRVFKDTSEQCYALGAMRPSSVESSSYYGVLISTVVEEGQVENVPVVAPSRKDAGFSRHHSSPREGKKNTSWSPLKLLRQFEVSSPSASFRKRAVVEDPNFASDWESQSPRGKTRESGRDQKAAPVFQGGRP